MENDDVRIPAIITIASLASAAALADDNLVAGGDFESAPQGAIGVDCHSTELPFLPGWTSNLGWRVDRHRHSAKCPPRACEPAHPGGGTYMISLQGSACCGCNNNGWIEQTVLTTPGRTYRLAFDAMLDQSDVLRVAVGSRVEVFTGDAMLEWRGFVVEFEATGATTLRFTSESPNGVTPNACLACWEATGCLLDNVTMTDVECAGDVIVNGTVDAADVAALLSVWGTDGGLYPRADANGDGLVDGGDLATVLSGWGACP